jgi:hypothetical protein
MRSACNAAVVVAMTACTGSAIPPSPAAPSPGLITITGRVTDSATAAPIPGATVSINGRSWATTDASGNYSVSGRLDAAINADYTYVSAPQYFSDYRYIRLKVHDIRLRPIERINAGGSIDLTVSAQDSLCVNNAQDTPGLGPDYVCRSVRVVAPGAGVVTIEASSAASTRPQLEVETTDDVCPCFARIENPITIRVTDRTEPGTDVEPVCSIRKAPPPEQVSNSAGLTLEERRPPQTNPLTRFGSSMASALRSLPRGSGPP